VLTAVDVREDRQVVVKRIRFPERATSSRLRQAHQVLSGLRVAEVAPVRELHEGKSDSWLVWDRVAGLSLRQYRETLPISNGADFETRWGYIGPVFDAILHGLESMHRSRLAHLALKPSNVLVSPDGNPVLVDIGVEEDAEAPDEEQSAADAQDLGFTSPEQANGAEAGILSDQWSLAALLYFLLTGEKPVQVEDAAELARAYERSQVKSLREHLGDTPEQFEEVVLRMLQWEPGDRFEDLASVRAALKGFDSKRPVAASQFWAVAPPPLVGRDPFLAFFAKRMRELEAGVGCVLQVIADEGYGKSRLLAAWEESVHSTSTATVYSASCQPSQPRAVLGRWFQPPSCDPDAPPPQDLVEQALARFDGPTVLFLDALEELDSISWARIHRAAAEALRTGRDAPLLVVLAGRQLPELAPRIDLDDPRLFTVALPPLSPADVAELLRPESRESDDIAVRDSAASLFCEESGGIPAVLLATFAREQREGRLQRDGRRWIARVGHGLKEQVMRARPRQLDEVLTLLSAVGETVEVAIALRCLPLAMADVLDALDWAAQNDLIRYRVVDDRWYLSIAEGCVRPGEEQPVRLVTLHEAVARWLEEHGECDGLCAERTAGHWRAAAAPRLAGQAYLRAARANGRIGSNTEARRLAQLGRTLLPRG
jgi:hypothetical protein